MPAVLSDERYDNEVNKVAAGGHDYDTRILLSRGQGTPSQAAPSPLLRHRANRRLIEQVPRDDPDPLGRAGAGCLGLIKLGYALLWYRCHRQLAIPC